jgi:dihydroflavonol-4-reductase
MPTAFVTGATGFLGVNLIHELLADGWRVVALHRPTSDLRRLRGLTVEMVSGTITDADSILRVMPEELDAVFHVAGNTTLWSRRHGEQFRDNVEGTRNVARAALAKGARRFVQTSSVAAFGDHRGRIDESTPSIAARSSINYSRTKWLAEKEVEAAIADGLDAVMINPTHILGPFDDGNWARMFTMVAEDRLPGVPPGRGSFCHVREVARAHISAVEKGRTGERYLLGGADASFLEVVQVIGRLTGRKVPTRTVPEIALKLAGTTRAAKAFFTGREPDLTPEAARMVSKNLTVDSSKAERELGYRPVPLETILTDCYDWLRSEGLLA